jgi:hypothetical protein
LKEDLKAKLDDEDVDGDDETEKSSGLLAVWPEAVSEKCQKCSLNHHMLGPTKKTYFAFLSNGLKFRIGKR